MPHNLTDDDNAQALELSVSRNFLSEDDHDDFQYHKDSSDDDTDFSDDEEPDFVEIVEKINRGNAQLREAQFLRSLVSEEIPTHTAREHKKEKPIKRQIKPVDTNQTTPAPAKPHGMLNLRHLKRELEDTAKQLRIEELKKSQEKTKRDILLLQEQINELRMLCEKIEQSNDNTKRLPPTQDETPLDSELAKHMKRLIDYMLLEMGGVNQSHVDYKKFADIDLNTMIKVMDHTINIYLRSQQHHPDKHIKLADIQAKFRHDLKKHIVHSHHHPHRHKINLHIDIIEEKHSQPLIQTTPLSADAENVNPLHHLCQLLSNVLKQLRACLSCLARPFSLFFTHKQRPKQVEEDDGLDHKHTDERDLTGTPSPSKLKP